MEKIKYYFFVLSILSSLGFLNPLGIVSPQFQKLLFYLIGVLSLYIAITRGCNLHERHYPRKSFLLLIVGMIISSFMPTFYHGQSLSVTLISTLPYFLGYIYFFIFLKLDVQYEKVIRLLWVLCFVGMSVYVINMISFPNILFGVREENYDLTRGIARLSIPFMDFIVLLFFFSINRWIRTNKRKWILLIILSSIYIVLSVTRQSIICSFVLGILFILKKASLIKKIAVVVILYFCITYFIPQIPIFKTMMELTQTQIDQNKYDDENIRLKAWKFYTYEYQTNDITAILGNGMPSFGKSFWGNKVQKETKDNGCLMVDVGWAGFYWFFGIFATIGIFSVLMYAAFKKKDMDKQYLTYWIIYIILTSFASGALLYYHQILNISIVLYLIYAKSNNKQNSYSHIKLQQFRRYN